MAHDGSKPNGLKVRSQDGEDVKRLLLSHSLLDPERRISRNDRHVIFPIKTAGEGKLDELDVPGSQLVIHDFEALKRRPRSIRSALASVLMEDELPLVGSSYDVIGRILVIELADELDRRADEVGRTLLDWLPVDTVALKISPTSGEGRVRGLRVIAGSDTLETVHRENGLMFKLDLSKVFFNPRLGGERARVSESCRDGRMIIDMFAGVGSFSITIDRAHVQGETTIISIDNNPHAYQYLKDNARLNRAWRVLPKLGDSLTEVPKLASELGRADRIIMNLPKEADRFLEVAVGGLKKSGMLHYYRLLPQKGARGVVEDELASHGRFRIEVFREVEAYSPSKSIYVADSVLLD